VLTNDEQATFQLKAGSGQFLGFFNSTKRDCFGLKGGKRLGISRDGTAGFA
jgi:hypothetical protein